jgi:hypothetical protein
VRAISSTSQRAITPSAGGKLTEARGGKVDTLPPADGVIGLRQVDEMALRPRRERSISGAHHPPESPARVGTRRHAPAAQTAQGGTARSSRSRRVRLDTVEATVSIPVSPTTNGPWSEARRVLFDQAVRRRTASGARPLVFGGHGPG